jgi:hypothetical protein
MMKVDVDEDGSCRSRMEVAVLYWLSGKKKRRREEGRQDIERHPTPAAVWHHTQLGVPILRSTYVQN